MHVRQHARGNDEKTQGKWKIDRDSCFIELLSLWEINGYVFMER